MVDYARITIKAGNGGDGAVHFRREKYVPKGGPDGGDGGRGGSVFLETDANLSTLSEFRFRQKFYAGDGGRGEGEKKSGKAGENVVVKVPVGTLIKFQDIRSKIRVIDMDRGGMEVLVAKGGQGGRGNWRFRSATNQAPKEAEEGERTEVVEMELELKLLADVGLVGLPNVGKSTLLSVLTKARPKIADYPFTTLEPNLGIMELAGRGERTKGAVIADIPGLIEGASKGKGLGQEFLRHVERCRVLVHVLAVDLNEEGEEWGEKLWQNYQTVRRELGEYEEGLLKKKEVLVLNKTDLLSGEQVEGVKGFFGKKKKKILFLSAATGKGMEELKKTLV